MGAGRMTTPNDESPDEQVTPPGDQQRPSKSFAELKDRADAALRRPFFEMIESYVNKGVAVIENALDALEAPKKKGD